MEPPADDGETAAFSTSCLVLSTTAEYLLRGTGRALLGSAFLLAVGLLSISQVPFSVNSGVPCWSSRPVCCNYLVSLYFFMFRML